MSNQDSALLTLAAQGTGTVISADQDNPDGRGVTVVVDITAIGGTPTLTVTVQGKDVSSGKYYTLLASAALAIVGTTRLTIYPGCIAVANATANLPLPRVWRVSAVVAGTTPSVTAKVGASVVS